MKTIFNQVKHVKVFVSLQLLICIVLCGCNNQNESKEADAIIKIDPTESKSQINISEFADSVKYIKLQTDKSCIIGRIAKLIIKKRYIYVCDVTQMIVFVFDKKGNFIAKLDKRGKGPEEYLGFAGLFVEDEEGFIEVFTRQGEILKYSNITFKFIEKTKLQRISSNYSIKVNDTYYFTCQQNRNEINGKKTNADIIIAKNDIIKPIFDKVIITKNTTFVPSRNLPVLNGEKELFTSILYSNTFYKLQNFNAIPFVTIDFGVYGINDSIRMMSVQEQIDFLHNIPAEKALMPELTLNTSNIMALQYAYSSEKGKMTKHEFIMLKKQGITYQSKIINNDLTNFPTIASFSTSTSHIPHQILYDDYLVNIILPSNEFLFRPGKSKLEVEGLGTIYPGDNPIIVLYKFKDSLL